MAAEIKRLMAKPWRKLTKTEKGALSIVQIEAAGGEAISLNFGIRREAALMNHHNPRRLFEKQLNKHLNAVGLRNQRFVFAFEITPADAHGNFRLHVHGAFDTSGLTQDELDRLEQAMCRAASVAIGAIGGERQFDRRRLYDASGWIDYCLDDQARTKRELKVTDLWSIPTAMRQAAKNFHTQARKRVRKLEITN